MNKVLIGIIGVMVLLALYGISMSNSFVRLDQNVEEKAANIKTALQRRYDLIPNLVAVVKGYAAHERGTFEAVTNARAKVGQFVVDEKLLSNPELFKKFQAAQGELSSALSRLMAVSERYPDLKADGRFAELQAQLEGTENRLKVERDNYNKAVRTFNEAIGQFPASMFAGGRIKKSYFDVSTPDAEKAPEVKF